VDRGEPVQDAAIRETREESNLPVRIVRLLNVYSYPDHPVIVIVFVAEAVAGEPSAGDETLEAGTFLPEDIPWSELAFPSTAQALREYLATDGEGAIITTAGSDVELRALPPQPRDIP
ncbi:MAG: NUDIX domain-containing protein, partial [Nitrospirae bacterium]